MSIEATVHASMQKNKGKGDQTYASKNRTLLRYLQDDSNYELRLKVLTNEKKPEDLCQAEEAELAPSYVNKLIQDKEEQLKKESFIKEENRLISKSHKGEQIIEGATPVSDEKPKPKDNVIEIDEDDHNIEDFSYDVDFSASFSANRVKNVSSDTGLKESKKVINNGSNAISQVYNANNANHYQTSENYNFKKIKGKLEDGLSTSSGGFDKKYGTKNVTKTYEESLNVSVNLLNKSIDQDLYKTLKENTVEKIYILLSDRIKQNLRNETGQYLLECLEKSCEKL